MKRWNILAGASVALLGMVSAADAAPIRVLWWDTTPEYGGQASDPLRQAMSDYLTNFDGGGVFVSTYRDAEFQPGTLASTLASSSYDVVVFDSTPPNSQTSFNAADFSAMRSMYGDGKNNIMLDGTLYIRSISFNATTVFPGPNGALGGLLANQVMQIANRGGGFLIGTDHNCCQAEANSLLQTLVTGAAFTGITDPTNDGTFFGADLLNGGAAAIAAVDVFNHWDSVPSQAIAPTGDFVDYLGNDVTLYSQVDVADQGTFGLVAGQRYSYISTSWAPGDGETDIDDDTPGGDGGGGGGGGTVPLPGTAWLVLSSMALLGLSRRVRVAAARGH